MSLQAMLDAFKVAAVKEGLSSAMTQQRNADNLKNVASMDALAAEAGIGRKSSGEEH